MRIHKLTARDVSSAGIGKHGDGGGLWLRVRDNGSRAWVFRYTRNGCAREMGLGPVEDVSLKMARKMARDSRQLVREGKDPISVRRLAMRSDIPTFEEAADRYAKAHAAKWLFASIQNDRWDTHGTWKFNFARQAPTVTIKGAGLNVRELGWLHWLWSVVRSWRMLL